MPKDLEIELMYPGVGDNPMAVRVGLTHVRAADELRISYDFDRDGWKIEQATIFEWSIDDPIQDEGWIETAFCRAWPFGAPGAGSI